MDVRPINESQDKFAKRAEAAAPDYGKGVSNAGNKWAAGAQSSDETWKSGTQDAVNNNRYAAGVRKAGAASKYQDRATKLGSDRYRAGVKEGAKDWAAGFQPHHQMLQTFDAGKKGMRGSQENYDRSRNTGMAFRAKKLELLGQR